MNFVYLGPVDPSSRLLSKAALESIPGRKWLSELGIHPTANSESTASVTVMASEAEAMLWLSVTAGDRWRLWGENQSKPRSNVQTISTQRRGQGSNPLPQHPSQQSTPSQLQPKKPTVTPKEMCWRSSFRHGSRCSGTPILKHFTGRCYKWARQTEEPPGICLHDWGRKRGTAEACLGVVCQSKGLRYSRGQRRRTPQPEWSMSASVSLPITSARMSGALLRI